MKIEIIRKKDNERRKVFHFQQNQVSGLFFALWVLYPGG